MSLHLQAQLSSITQPPSEWCCGFKLFCKEPTNRQLQRLAELHEGPQAGLEFCPIRKIPYTCLCDHTDCDAEAEYDFYVISQVIKH